MDKFEQYVLRYERQNLSILDQAESDIFKRILMLISGKRTQ